MPQKFPALDAAKGELNNLRKGLKDVFDEAGPDLDMSRVKSVSGDKIAWIREQKKHIDDAAKTVAELTEVAGIAAANLKEYVEPGDIREDNIKTRDGHQSLGQAFIKSQAFQNKGVKSALDGVNLKTLFERSNGWTPEETRSGKVVLDAQRPAVHVVNYIPTSPVSQTAYKYMEETTYTNAAQETAEAGTYQQAALELTERFKTVEKVAVWLPVTDEQLEDEAGAEAYVNQRLTNMMQQRVDSQVMVGNGSTPNILGTENVAGIATRAKGTDSIPDAAYKLFTTIREDAFAEPSVCFLRASKWQEVALMKTADGQYIWNHPSTTGPLTLWGVPVVLTTVVTATKLVTGDYSTYSLLGVKRGLEMQITNSHASDFIEGKQAIRADLRLVMVHFRPEAFGTVTGL